MLCLKTFDKLDLNAGHQVTAAALSVIISLSGLVIRRQEPNREKYVLVLKKFFNLTFNIFKVRQRIILKGTR
jgi:hypothetical protein